MRAVSFDDFDACSAALRDWELEAVRLDRGSFRAERVQTRSASDGDLSVTRVANRWGFHHMSQFAALKQRQFDELPSETMWAGKPSR